ncbi:cell division protein FtsQ [Halolactibacillus alkaliphilus]|nr:cell division protein FtsQ [Halolactibacillus alkaliphilus]
MMTDEKKVVSIEERIPRLREARRKKANRRFIFYLSFLLFLIAIVVYLQSPLSYIRQIMVEGNEFVPEEKIVEASQLSTTTSIWAFRVENIEAAIEKIPEIQSVKVVRQLPHDLEISVIEHKKIAYVDRGESLSPLLESGATLKKVSKSKYQGDAPILIDFSADEVLALLVDELQALPTYLLSHISEIYYAPTESNPYQVHLNMIDGFELLTSIRGFNEHLRVYPSIVSQLNQGEPGLIEIDHAGAVFNKFSNQEDSLDPDLEVYAEGEENQLNVEEDEQ